MRAAVHCQVEVLTRKNWEKKKEKKKKRDFFLFLGRNKTKEKNKQTNKKQSVSSFMDTEGAGLVGAVPF